MWKKGKFMTIKPKSKSLTLFRLYQVFLGLAILEGILALWFLFLVPSETRNSSIFNYSLQRFGTGLVIFLILVIFMAILADSLGSQKFLKFITARIERILEIDISHCIIKTTLSIILVSSLASLLFYTFPALQRLILFLPDNYIFGVLGVRAGVLIGWIFLISLKMLLLYLLSKKGADKLAIPVKLMTIAWIVEGFVLALFVIWSLISRKLVPEQFAEPGARYCFSPCGFPSGHSSTGTRNGLAGSFILL